MWQQVREKIYEPVSDTDVEDAGFSINTLLGGTRDQKLSGREGVILACQYVPFFVAIVLAFGLGVLFGEWQPQDLDHVCIRHTSNYSPILDGVPITYGEWQFNGSFTHEEIYRQDPSKELDRAWDDLGISNRVMVISEEEGRKSGLTPENHIRINDKYGGGYPVLTEGLHHLHCLNLLRKSLWYQIDYYNQSQVEEFVPSNAGQPFRWHVTHRLDILRQGLMCDVDTGVFGAVWYGNASNPIPFVDFNTRHVCKDFDAIRRWATEHRAPEELPDDYWAAPGPEVIIRPDIP